MIHIHAYVRDLQARYVKIQLGFNRMRINVFVEIMSVKMANIVRVGLAIQTRCAQIRTVQYRTNFPVCVVLKRVLHFIVM